MSTLVNGARLKDGYLLVECNGALLIVCDYLLTDDDTHQDDTWWSAFTAVEEVRNTPFAWSPPEAWWDRSGSEMTGDMKTADEVVADLRQRFERVRVLS